MYTSKNKIDLRCVTTSYSHYSRVAPSRHTLVALTLLDYYLPQYYCCFDLHLWTREIHDFEIANSSTRFFFFSFIHNHTNINSSININSHVYFSTFRNCHHSDV